MNHALPSRIKAAIARRFRVLGRLVDSAAASILRHYAPFSTTYYALFNRGLDRETKAVLAGRRIFELNRNSPNETSSLVRRNVHRLEKGILMRPRRSVFALDYVQETVDAYAHLIQEQDKNDDRRREELAWAHDVISEYFKITDKHPRTDKARETFRALADPSSLRAVTSIPYKRSSQDYQIPCYDALVQLSKQRRSVRWFKQIPVDRSLVLKALEVATQAPSACNRQPFIFRFYDDPEMLRKVAKLPGGTKGFAHNFPMIAVVIGELRNYYSEKDRHLIYIDSSLAVMSFIFALETLGLSSCCINWPDIKEAEEQARNILELEEDQRPIMFIAIGHADPEGLVAFSQKKPPAELAVFNYK